MRRPWLAAALILLSSATALAESEEEESTPLSAAPIETSTGPKLNEVEHGFYIGAFTGLALTLSPGGANYDGSKAGMAMGQSGGLELGFEPNPLFGIGLIVSGATANTPSTYVGTCDVSNPPDGGTCAHGNFTSLTIGADARLNLSLGPDSNDVRRAYFFIRAGLGYSILTPKNLLQNELVAFGGPGFEYFTHLRHFSVGLEADASYGLTNKGLGISVQPLVRYTF